MFALIRRCLAGMRSFDCYVLFSICHGLFLASLTKESRINAFLFGFLHAATLSIIFECDTEHNRRIAMQGFNAGLSAKDPRIVMGKKLGAPAAPARNTRLPQHNEKSQSATDPLLQPYSGTGMDELACTLMEHEMV
jgi:hypothetical protein